MQTPESDCSTRDDSFSPVIVKFVSKGGLLKDSDVWRRQLPERAPAWGRCQFTFDPDARDYHWLAVYDDLPPVTSGPKPTTRRIEQLACPKEHTILITAEPSTIKVYCREFLAQFGHVLTSQEPWAIRHPHAIFSQPALRWFYGVPNKGDRRGMPNYTRLKALEPSTKDRIISTVSSSKQMSHTLHRTRYDFVRSLQSTLPELEVYGHGIRGIIDKAEALDRYKYHIAIENHICKHHWTEKLSDAFIGYCLPFYAGCPNASDYFPPESFIPIDINDFEKSLKTIKEAIANNEYENRLSFIRKARELVLDKYNIFAVLDQQIGILHNAERIPRSQDLILSRHALRTRGISHISREMVERTQVKLRHAGMKIGLGKIPG